MLLSLTKRRLGCSLDDFLGLGKLFSGRIVSYGIIFEIRDAGWLVSSLDYAMKRHRFSRELFLVVGNLLIVLVN